MFAFFNSPQARSANYQRGPMYTKEWAKCMLPIHIAQSVKTKIDLSLRFVASPIVDIEKRISSETTELKSDITNLEKKLHYLETTHKNSRDHINQIFNSGSRA